jgi:hypothetical protein
LGFVLPASFEFADYASTVRASLTRLFDAVWIHRSFRPLFSEVSDGSVVLVAVGFRGLASTSEEPGASARQTHPDLSALVAALSISDRVAPGAVEKAVEANGGDGTRLGDVMSVSIGAVTGYSPYFLLSEKDRLGLSLPQAALVPVVSRARHLSLPVLTDSAWRVLLNAGERVWLFRPEPNAEQDPAVLKYLEAGASGACRLNASHVSRRATWYVTEMPMGVDGFVSGMTKRGPLITLNRMKGASATNTLYVVRFKERASLDDRAAWSIALLTSEVREQVGDLRRHYAGGLLKLEPRDLKQLTLPTPVKTRGALRKYSELLLLLEESPAVARLEASRWFQTRRKAP